jgi:hypothetical protein
MNASGYDLQQCRFPGTISSQDGVGMIFLKGITEIPEDPFRVVLFAGTGQNDFSQGKDRLGAGNLSVPSIFHEF